MARSVTQRRGRWRTCGHSVRRDRCAISTRTPRCSPRGMPSSTSAGVIATAHISARVVSCARAPRIHARPTHTRASHAYTRVPCIHCMHTLCVPIHATQPPGRRRVRGNGARRARAHRRSRADRHAQLLEAARAGLAAVAALAGAAHQPHVGHGGGLQEGPAGAHPRAALRRGPVPAHARLLPLAR